jgi:hypothetical protein
MTGKPVVEDTQVPTFQQEILKTIQRQVSRRARRQSATRPVFRA